jgi:hypothetical protein
LVGRSRAQLVAEFVTAPTNRFRMQARDLRDPFDSAMSETLGLAASHPAALLFVQAAQQQIELPMLVSSCLLTCSTRRTTALVNRQFHSHRPTPFLGLDANLHQSL